MPRPRCPAAPWLKRARRPRKRPANRAGPAGLQPIEIEAEYPTASLRRSRRSSDLGASDRSGTEPHPRDDESGGAGRRTCGLRIGWTASPARHRPRSPQQRGRRVQDSSSAAARSISPWSPNVWPASCASSRFPRWQPGNRPGWRADSGRRAGRGRRANGNRTLQAPARRRHLRDCLAEARTARGLLVAVPAC